jgi:squalene-hopene/tetraprenyl-beta-curcumene cyclase
MTRLAISIVIGALSVGGVAFGGAAQGAREAPGWDREGAARYLDARMDLWFASAKKLESSRGATVCVSCHTAVPYALARPALRRAMRAGAATSQELRLVEIASGRVDTYDTHQVFYDFNDGKIRESRGTEAVLNALILATGDANRQRSEPSDPARKAFKRLWELQRADGRWDWLDFGLEPWEGTDAAYYGAALGAMAIGTAPGLSTSQDPQASGAIGKLRGYLKSGFDSQSLFNRTWALLASTRLTGSVTNAQREALVADLEHRQRSDGGWSLQTLGPWKWSKPAPPFRGPGAVDDDLLASSDGYATGLIVHALREAGVGVDRPVVSRGLQWLRTHQQDVGSGEEQRRAWRAHSLNFDREHGGEKGEPFRRMFMSDAATALAVLALTGDDRKP